jgi:hypothetical protein
VKIKKEHYEILESSVSVLDTSDRRRRYRAGDFPRSEFVQDVDKRYRWDLFTLASNTVSPSLVTTMYAEEYSDAHIDTALRRIVPALGEG